MATRWKAKGTVLIACNCAYGCPCNFNALPTYGHCEGGWTWHIDEGRFGDTDLSGVTFGVYCDWPGAIHEGNGVATVLIDEGANEAQRVAIQTLVSGAVGGPWGILKNTWTTVYGPRFVPYEIELADQRSRTRAADSLLLEMEPIRNPVTGVEATPGAVLPQGFISKSLRFATSRLFRVKDGVDYDHSGNYTAVGSFDYGVP